MKFFILVIALVGCAMTTGCGDTGNPKTDRAIGAAEVGLGQTLQAGGGAVAVGSPEPGTKAAGAAAVGVGAALEADGRARIDRANRREGGSK